MGNNKISLMTVIIIGHIIITIPVVIIICLSVIIFLMVDFNFNVGIILGAGIGWIYWAYVTPRWRKWAIEKGVNEDKLYKYAKLTFLIW